MDCHGEDELGEIVDPTKIGSSIHNNVKHNADHIRAWVSKLPEFTRPEKNFTDEFFDSLEFPLPKNRIELVNIHIYGGPASGKSTLARAIGYKINDHYGDICQCIECSYLPDAIPHINPNKRVVVISVDDPMGAAEGGGTQDARRASSGDVDHARSTYNAIRHIYKKRVLESRARQHYGRQIPDHIIKHINAYHDNEERLKEIFPQYLARVGAILFVIWGPQLPTIDQTFHQNKHWNIYKGFSAMDQKREVALRKTLGYDWARKLSDKEWAWRKRTNPDAQSWSVIENAFTHRKGWLYVQPAEDNIFKKVDRGGKGYQEKMKADTENNDLWARHIYENRNSLMPPYDPFGKQEDRKRAITNFIRDILKSNKDPRTFEELAPHTQIFLKRLLEGKISSLDDRIIKYHFQNMNERESIEALAQELINILEEEGITPNIAKARNIIHDIARRKLITHRQMIDKPSNFRKIYDHLLYLWSIAHPEERKGKVSTKPKIEIDEELIESTMVQTDDSIIEFTITEEEIIDNIMKNYPEYIDRALIYMHTEGIKGRDILTNRQMYKISLDEKQREKYGFPNAFTSIEAVKYRKQQFRGLMSYVLGGLFEDWLEKILVEGYYIPGMIENVKTVRHSNYEQKGQPDFILAHDDGSTTVLSAKCYASDRSETLEKEEMAPELRYHNTLLEKGKESRLAVVYANINIPHMLVVRIYPYSSDVPSNLTFPPSEAGRIFFRKD